MRVYDPTCGSGGMLIQSKAYVEEQGQDPRNLSLFGQESNGGTWSICKMNMILHDVNDADIRNEDTIAHPKHTEGGELMHFNRVLANPPFSQNYSKSGMEHPERFAYGFAPETGKKADLMFAQHMVASLNETGKMATVMPHGVLFRGGAEKTIRKGLVDHDVIEAIIGLPPALFYGTGIPACILVINRQKPAELENKILFINADAEYGEGKAQNHLRPEDIEKISHVYHHREVVPKYSSIVDREEIAGQDYNLNIRRYVDNSPDPEPHDVRAHLLGGVPKAEVAAKATVFDRYGLNNVVLLKERDADYFEFIPEIHEKEEIRRIIEAEPTVVGIDEKMRRSLATWWENRLPRLARLSESNNLFAIRQEFLASLKVALVPVGLLDTYQVAGVFVNWWVNSQFDLKAIRATGWTPTLLTDEKTLQTPEGKRLLEKVEAAEDQLRQLEAEKAELEGDPDEDVDSAEDVDEVALREVKRKIAAQKRIVKALEDEKEALIASLRDSLDEERTKTLALEQLYERLCADLERYLTQSRRELSALYENWWDKYKVTAREIEAERNAAKERLETYLRELGYGA